MYRGSSSWYKNDYRNLRFQAKISLIDPKISHEKAIHIIDRYLKGKTHNEIIFKSNKVKKLECYTDAAVAGG